MIYFTSDLHFGHSNIVKFHPCFRPFSSVEAMDRALIGLWNERINPCDTVYNIGDLSFHKDMQTSISIFSKLNGRHVLVLDNKGEAIKSKTATRCLRKFANTKRSPYSTDRINFASYSFTIRYPSGTQATTALSISTATSTQISQT